MSVKTPLHVRFYETDLMGVVHHSNYIRWFEIGRVDFLRSIGIELQDLMNDKILFPITEVRAKYTNPSHFDENLELETIPVHLTKVKMEFEYVVRNGEKILVRGFSQNVFTDMATGRITRLPEKYSKILEKAMAEELAKMSEE